jgi:deoxyribonuclease (pyrimidine dimer)
VTRVNCVPVEELHPKHLVAEYREIARIPALAYAAYSRGEEITDPRNPENYVLGTGHVRFFYGRLGYISQRFGELVSEMLRRGYNPKHLSLPDLPTTMPAAWRADWEPCHEAMSINRQRIRERMPKGK